MVHVMGRSILHAADYNVTRCVARANRRQARSLPRPQKGLTFLGLLPPSDNNEFLMFPRNRLDPFALTASSEYGRLVGRGLEPYVHSTQLVIVV